MSSARLYRAFQGLASNVSFDQKLLRRPILCPTAPSPLELYRGLLALYGEEYDRSCRSSSPHWPHRSCRFSLYIAGLPSMQLHRMQADGFESAVLAASKRCETRTIFHFNASSKSSRESALFPFLNCHKRGLAQPATRNNLTGGGALPCLLTTRRLAHRSPIFGAISPDPFRHGDRPQITVA